MERDHQKCSKCEKVLNFSFYSKNKTTKSGYAYTCKACMKAYKTSWENNPATKLKAKRYRKTKKEENWYKWKCRVLIGNWKRRAKSVGLTGDSIPSLDTLMTWLKSKEPFVCFYSGDTLDRKDIQLDHKIPTSRGGTFNLDNIAICSRKMNSVKGSLTETEFTSLLNLLDHLGDYVYDDVIKRLSASSYIFTKGKR